jgi:hypothetical protein
LSTIKDPDQLSDEEAVLKANLMQRIKSEQAEQKEWQRQESLKRNAAIEAEKHERKEMARRAHRKEEEECIHKLREEVAEYPTLTEKGCR